MIEKNVYIGSIRVNMFFDKDDIYQDDDYFTLYETAKNDLKHCFKIYVMEKDLNVNLQKEIYKSKLLRILDNEKFTCIENSANARCIYYKTYYEKETNIAYIIYDRSFGMKDKVSILSSSQFIYAFLFFIQHKNYLILHSNLTKGNSGLLFCGESGRGKTTISRLFDKNGFKIITDETVLIEIDDKKIIGYGTPWAGREHLYYHNDSAEINSLFVIEHSLENIIKAEGKNFFANYLLKQSYPFFYISKSVAFQYSKIQKILSMLKNYYVLGFVPDSSVCTFIEEYL